jgi:hypothetical protein
MADYQSLLARAVANLPPSSTAAARQAIYDRARKALVTQLRSLRPPLPESDIEREEAALGRAIDAVEAKFNATGEEGAIDAAQPIAEAAPGPQPRSAPKAQPRPDPAPREAAAERPAGAASPAPPSPSPNAGLSQPARAAPSSPRPVEFRPIPARPSAPAAPSRPAAPPISTRPAVPAHADALKPPPVQAASPGAEGADAPPVIAAQGEDDAPASANLGAVVPRQQARAVEASGAPPIVSGREDDVESLAVAPEVPLDGERIGLGRPEAEGLRPVAPSAPVEKGRSWPWAVLALVFGIVLSVAVAAILMRQKPQDLAINPPARPAPEAAQSPAKIAQRAQSPSTEGVPDSQPSAPPANQPQTAQPPAEGGAPANPPQGAQSETQLPSAARAAMLIASADNPQKPVVNLGSTVWSTIPAPAGQPSGVAIEADADIPDLKMHASMILRKNGDPTLQATHTIDLKFTFQDGAPFNGFKDVGLPQMRKLDSTGSEALSSVKVKIGDDYFLFALAKGDQDAPRNLDLIQTRAWFDFPLLLNDNRIAKLVFQKSSEGQAMLEKALDAWK